MGLDNARVERIYEKLTGKKMERGAWNAERKNFAERMVHVDEACLSVIAAIAAIENAKPGDDIHSLERALRTEFRFLQTIEGYD